MTKVIWDWQIEHVLLVLIFFLLINQFGGQYGSIVFVCLHSFILIHSWAGFDPSLESILPGLVRGVYAYINSYIPPSDMDIDINML